MVEVIDRRRAKEPLLCHQLHALFFISAFYDFEVTAQHTLSSWASAERVRFGERKIGQIDFTILRVGPIPSNVENLPLCSISVLTLLLNYEH